jgi:hypothetical protein
MNVVNARRTMPGIRTLELSTRGRIRIPLVALGGAIFVFAGLLPLGAAAQDAASPAAKPVTVLGTVQALSGNTITVKSDAGAAMQVTVEENARLLRIEPGQKTLAGASPFSLSDLQVGDRVMARGSMNAQELAATMLVAIKGADIAQKQAREREDWQKRGTGGLVKSVDPAAGTVTISTGSGSNRMLVIHASATTILRRYAPGSVKFDQAATAPLDQIKPGDQLRARGPRSADGGTLEAEEIVSGSFLNLAGPVQAINPAASTITVNDTATKKAVVISLTPDSEVKKLDPAVAQRLAVRLSGGGARPPNGSPGRPAGSPGAASSGPPSGASDAGRPAGASARAAGADFQQILTRAPSITLKDLQKGNMVIVVATEGNSPESATAITVVAGVEPMLQASTSASQAMLSSSWNLGGGGEGGGDAPQ